MSTASDDLERLTEQAKAMGDGFTKAPAKPWRGKRQAVAPDTQAKIDAAKAAKRKG